MRMPPYLMSCSSGYYFRFAIPLALRPLRGQSEIRKSLHTHDRRKALLMAATTSANVLQQIKTIKEDMGKLPQIDLDNYRLPGRSNYLLTPLRLKMPNLSKNHPNDFDQS